MKMPPQKPVGNGYYGYEEVPHLPENNAVENSTTAPLPESTAPQQPPPNVEHDFSEYMWMENEEEFDKQVMQELEEEELMEQCIEAMLEEEHLNLNDERPDRINLQEPQAAESNDVVNHLVNNFKLKLVDVTQSTLNPLAAEFVPDARSTLPTTSE